MSLQFTSQSWITRSFQKPAVGAVANGKGSMGGSSTLIQGISRWIVRIQSRWHRRGKECLINTGKTTGSLSRIENPGLTHALGVGSFFIHATEEVFAPFVKREQLLFLGQSF